MAPPKSPEITAEEPVDLPPLSPSTLNPKIVNHDVPMVKGYSWIPEHEIDTRPKHNANLADHLSLDPKTYIQALNSPDGEEWIKAINVELKNMAKHQVWSPTEETNHIKPLSTTWVFKRKTGENGNLSKFKARLCVWGFHQKEGVEYNEVFSLAGCLSSLRLLLTLCHINRFPIEQMDVRCAFLNRMPEEVLHIFRPSGYTDHPEANVFVLNKSLYGLKQSPRCWHQVLKRTLTTIGLSPCYTDPCLYYSQNRNQPLWLFVHVVDLIFGGTWNSLFKEKIKSFFEMEDLGAIKYALGIRITQSKESICLIQDKFIKQILLEFSIEKAKAPPSPLPSNYKELRTLTLKPPKQPPFNFRRAVGLLQYLVQCTRPNLSFATSFISQFLESPCEPHYQALIHTLKYISGMKHFSLKLGQNHLNHLKSEIVGFTDSDWGGGTEKKSFSGSLIYFHGALGWRAYKKKVVALSSTEAEYNAMTESTQDLAWMKQIVQEAIGITCTCTLHSDNQTAISIASNPIYHHGTQHIEFCLHFIRNHLKNKLVRLKYLPTADMLADLLTKNLSITKTLPHLKKILSNPKLTTIGVPMRMTMFRAYLNPTTYPVVLENHPVLLLLSLILPGSLLSLLFPFGDQD
ncbi:hypothetical protein O181_004775 [Austropuccinia psidii MF-1]|uniref:Reverse transcriptase Ty1/copia-type domain-containing protein n=1 Tax=Austropuccinia psidii MF-1 TaxID=1389203 RepID=A0A9Q3BHN6_9BASI|nr:hypothetical protein [Austropuccinia psidii MF-1]